MEPDAQLAPRVLLAVNDALLRRVAGVALRERGFSVSATTDAAGRTPILRAVEASAYDAVATAYAKK